MRKFYFLILLLSLIIIGELRLAKTSHSFSLSLLESPDLDSIIVWEMTGQLRSYVFDKSDSRLITKIENLGPYSDSDIKTSALEYYDIYISDSYGNLKVNGEYITIACYRNNNLTNEEVGNNISAVGLKLKDGGIFYAQKFTKVILGSGLSEDFLNNQGYAFNAIGAPSYTKTTYLGDHFSSITLEFPSIYNIACKTNSDCGNDGWTGSPYCKGNSVYQNYITYKCNNPNTPSSYCSSSVSEKLIQTCASNETCQNGVCVYSSIPPVCTPFAYQRCVGNSLYWFDSCNNQGPLIQYCPYGCQFDQCVIGCYNCSYPQSICVSHSYKLCVGNSVYWFDSCGNRQELLENCSGNQICSYGQCVVSQIYPIYNPYYSIACYGNNLYWYDSQGIRSSFYKSCDDNNPCTIDKCLENRCSNVLKCDSLTCQIGSTAYSNYCLKNKCGDKICDQSLGENNMNCPQDCQSQAQNPMEENLSLSILAKTENESEWNRKIEVGPNVFIYFKVTFKNNGDDVLNNVKISFNIPSEVVFLGNLKIDEIPQGLDINEGISFGNIVPGIEKTIFFEGKAGDFSKTLNKQASVFFYTNNTELLKSDTMEIIFQPGKVAGAAVAAIKSPLDNFRDFLEKWYLWILIIIFAIFLFWVVFKKITKPTYT